MEWISVEDRLPCRSSQEIICCLNLFGKKHVIAITWMESKFMFFNSEYTDFTKNVTHWMPLPEPPKD